MKYPELQLPEREAAAVLGLLSPVSCRSMVGAPVRDSSARISVRVESCFCVGGGGVTEECVSVGVYRVAPFFF